MSHSHDKHEGDDHSHDSHDHDHGHEGHHHDHGDHGHSHDHDHGHSHDEHDHEHNHEHEAAAAPQILDAEDINSQALSDALKSSFYIVRAIMVILIVIFVGSGIFTVGPQQKAVIFRFGKPVGGPDPKLLGPGLQWAFPRPIDEVHIIPTEEIQTMTVTNWFFIPPEMEGKDPEGHGSLRPGAESYTITGDTNIVHMKATLSYRISDPVRFTLAFANASNVVRHVFENALFFASAQYPVDKILRLDPTGFRDLVFRRVESQVDGYKLGIKLQPPDITAVPPPDVKIAFEAVTAAQQTANTTKANAAGEASEILARANTAADSIINSAKAERDTMVLTLQAEASYFEQAMKSHKANPALFEKRKLTETWTKILTNSTDTMIVGERVGGGTHEIRLQINREPEQRAEPTNNVPGVPVKR
ncbi:MAG: hflK 2 [Verrucomicrobiales bacterium]|nr:hflK 2 [Verrucomicrobiales bacterium]